MKPDSPRTTKKNNDTERHIRTASSEIFPDGSIIELVKTRSVKGNEPALLLWKGDKAVVRPLIECQGRIYKPIELHPSLLNAIRLPVGAVSYGTTRELFTDIASLFERFIGFSQPEATAIAIWSATTWFPDCVASPPSLLITGPAMDRAITLFRLLNCLCRHPLMLADVSRSAICSLPMSLRPTLLVNQPTVSSKIRALWRASNFPGLFVPGKAGSVVDISCPKALYSGLEEVPDSWSDTALHLALPLGRDKSSLLDVLEQSRIANHFQSRLLMYRLHNLCRVRESRLAGGQLTSPTSELARSLTACIQGEFDSVKIVSSLLERQEQDIMARRRCDVDVAVIEAIWAPSHEAREISVSKVTELTNALLRCRGETLVYRATEMGWRLKNLGIYRHRNGKGMVLRFSQQMRVRVHQLAQELGLMLPSIDGCEDCAPPK